MKRTRAKQGDLSPADLFGNLAEALKQQATRPNMHAYVPHKKQEMFHGGTGKGRLYIGGNRSGKTTGGVIEDLWWVSGKHPFRPTPEAPVRGRVVGVDFLNGIAKILLPEFKRWTPPSLLRNGSWEDSYSASERTLTFENGSFIEFMSYDQDTDKFAGTSRHFTHFDEEPPQHVFNECLARLVDTNGDWWMTMTPVEGMTWIYDTIYLPGKSGENPRFNIVEVDMLDNPHLNPEAAEAFLSGLTPEERKAREKGEFVQLGGLVYKGFDERIHVVSPRDIFDGEFTPPSNWEWYASVDHGFNNPTAWLWHAVSPEGQVVTFSEHYESEMTVEQHAAIVHARNAMFNREPDIYCGDPAIAQRNGITGTSVALEYALHGIPIVPGINDVASGVNRVSTYLRPNPETGKPYWLITDNCVNLIREIKRLRWKTWASKKSALENNKHDQIHKKDDHAADSARYFFTLLPDLRPEQLQPKALMGPTDTVVSTYDQLLAQMVAPAETNWHINYGSEIAALEND